MGADGLVVRTWPGSKQETSVTHNDRISSAVSLRIEWQHNSSLVLCKTNTLGVNESHQSAIQLLVLSGKCVYIIVSEV